MPIYEYACAACGTHMEAIQKISDAPLVQCPQCQKPALIKLVSAAGFRLKGGGWYETDFKTSETKRNLAEGSESGSSGESSIKPKESSGESAVAKKDEGKSSSGKTETGSNSGVEKH